MEIDEIIEIPAYDIIEMLTSELSIAKNNLRKCNEHIERDNNMSYKRYTCQSV